MVLFVGDLGGLDWDMASSNPVDMFNNIHIPDFLSKAPGQSGLGVRQVTANSRFVWPEPKGRL
jgi:hypothetical protein